MAFHCALEDRGAGLVRGGVPPYWSYQGQLHFEDVGDLEPMLGVLFSFWSAVNDVLDND
jgi:hypothetical protein